MNDNPSFEDFEKKTIIQPKADTKIEPSAEAVATLPPESKPLLPQKAQLPEVVQQRQLANPEVNEYGGIQAKNFDEQWKVACVFAKSGVVPKSFDTPEKVMVAMQFCAERQLRFTSTVQKLMVVNGSISGWGEFPLSQCFASGHLESYEEYFLDAEGKKEEDASKIFEAVCTVKRKGFAALTRRFSRKDATAAQLIDKDLYKKYFKRMMQMKARGWALKDAFPDVLLGLAIAEYDHDVLGPEQISQATKHGTPSRAKADEINEIV